MNLKVNDRKWKVKTSDGFVNFHGVAEMGVKQLYEIIFDDGTNIEITDKHVFFTTDGREIQTRELSTGIELLGEKNKKVISINKTKFEQTYDIIDTDTHTYFINGLLCHNCVFLSSDSLLIDSLFLSNITKGIEAIVPKLVVNDVVLFEDIKPMSTYLAAVDPSTGSGEDYSVITIFEFPSLVQVGEYRSNTMSTNELYTVLKNILKYLEVRSSQVYFSIENNGVGQGLIALLEADEKPPEKAEFISEEGAKKVGFTTTAKSKMRACVNLKELLEKGQMEIRSKILLSELKSYVRYRGAYAAQAGSTDDCVSAVLVILYLVLEIASYEQAAFDKLYSAEFEEWSEKDWDGYEEGYDEDDEILPVIF